MFKSKTSHRHHTFLTLALLLLILTLCIMRFAGIPDQYDVMYAFFDEPELYTEDFYFKNSHFFTNSFFFIINDFIGLHRNEVVSFFFYLAVTGIAFFYTYKILTEHFQVKEPHLVLLILLFICFLERNIPVNTWGGLIPLQPGTATMFAKAMGIVAIYYMLEKSIWTSAILITMTLSIHVLADVILIPILFFFILFNNEIARKHLLALSLPITLMLYKKSMLETGGASQEDLEIMYEAVMAYTRQDADFLYQSKTALSAFVISFLVAPFLWMRLRNPQKNSVSRVALLKSIYLASLCVFVGATLYTTVGYRLYLDPSLIGLAPVRAMNYYTLFFYLSAFILIVQSARLSILEKVSIMLALVLLHGENLKGLSYPVIVLTIGFVSSKFTSTKLRKFNDTQTLVIVAMVLAVGLTSLQVVRGGKYRTTFNSESWQHMKKWTLRGRETAETWQAFSKIRDIPGDFSMLALTRKSDGLLRTSPYMNIYARKSLFVADGLHFYFRPDLWREHLNRKQIYEDILFSLDKSHAIQEKTVEALLSRKVKIVAPSDTLSFFWGWTKKTQVDGYYILKYN